MKYKLGQVALVLGVILIIMGFSTSQPAEWILGIILLALGIYDYAKRPISATLDEEKRIEELLRIAEEEGKEDA